MRKKISYLSIFIVVVILTSCTNPIDNSEKFIFVAHTRVNSKKHPQTVNNRLKNIDLSAFSLVLLGGDLTPEIAEDERSIAHVDSIFDFGSDSTLWALGNHDYSDLKLVKKYTHRPPYYAKYHNGITFVVLDTQDDYSNIKGDQLSLLKSVTDTISASSHFVIMHHKLIWWLGNPVLKSQKYLPNAPTGTCFDCLNKNNFYQDVYPLAQDVQERGIQVLFVGGDLGFQTSRFEHKTADGIIFLANGLHGFRKNIIGKNRYLVFNHDSKKAQLTWEYKALWMKAQYNNATMNKIRRYKKKILADSDRTNRIAKKAIRKGNTFDEQLQLDAIRINVPSELEAVKAHKRLSMKTDLDWYSQLKSDAIKRGVSLEEWMEINIKWMLDNDQF